MSPLAGAALLVMGMGFLLMLAGASDNDGKHLPLYVTGLALVAFGAVVLAVSFTQPSTFPSTEVDNLK